MLIDKSNLTLSASHELESATVRQVRLVRPPRDEAAFARLLDRSLQAPPAELLAIEIAPSPARPSAPDSSPFAAVMAMLSGLLHLRDGPRLLDGAPGRGLQVMEFVHTIEIERCTFAARGNVCLADGSTRQFDVGYRLERSEESNRLTAAALRDPLLLDFAAPAPGLDKVSVDFDLDGDGSLERMRMPAGNAAVLFNDLNHNGRADDGGELFGPQSGDGFGELARLDGDGNGWIDSGDAAFADLALWQIDDDGGSRVRSLADAGIGALSTNSEATPFTLKEDGATVGQVRASGVWLGENGGAGIVRQVDVATAPAKASSA